MFLHQVFQFLGRHDVKLRSYISTQHSIDIMTQPCVGSTYFSAQHILIKSSWAWQNKVILCTTRANPKSSAHLATRHSQIQGAVVDARKVRGTHRTWIQSQGIPLSMLDTCLICPHHECAQFWHFSAIFHISGPVCTIFSPPVHARCMRQCTVYGMLLVNISPHDSHATWVERSPHSRGAGPR